MGRLLGYTLCAVFSLMLLGAPIVLAGGGCINRNAANDGALATVQIKDCSFAPTVTRVPVDTAVTWKNVVDYLPHVIRAGCLVQPCVQARGRNELGRGGTSRDDERGPRSRTLEIARVREGRTPSRKPLRSQGFRGFESHAVRRNARYFASLAAAARSARDR